MRFRHRPRRLASAALITVTALVAAGCGIPTELLYADPEGRIFRDDVMGTWEDDQGRTIEFRDDHTYTAMGDAIGPGEGQKVEGGRLDGDWDLCYYMQELEEQKPGDPTGLGECEINSTGHWITMDSPDTWQGYMVVSFEEDIRFYLYTPGEGRHDAHFYTKV